MLIETQVAGALGAHELKESHRFFSGFQITQRLGFQAEMQSPSRPARDFFNVFNASPEIGSGLLDRSFVLDEFLEGNRHGADAALDPSGPKLSQNIEQPLRVFETISGRPVGRVNLFLHPAAVKFAVGKSVNREDVAVLFLEPVTK